MHSKVLDELKTTKTKKIGKHTLAHTRASRMQQIQFKISFDWTEAGPEWLLCSVERYETYTDILKRWKFLFNNIHPIFSDRIRNVTRKIVFPSIDTRLFCVLLHAASVRYSIIMLLSFFSVSFVGIRRFFFTLEKCVCFVLFEFHFGRFVGFPQSLYRSGCVDFTHRHTRNS